MRFLTTSTMLDAVERLKRSFRSLAAAVWASGASHCEERSM